MNKTKEIASDMNATVLRNKLNVGKGFALNEAIVECLKYNPDLVAIDAVTLSVTDTITSTMDSRIRSRCGHRLTNPNL